MGICAGDYRDTNAESMIMHSRSTHAEVSDVVSATHFCADAIMLSSEIASGEYSVEAVQTMVKIVREIERHQWRYGSQVFADRRKTGFFNREAVAHAALELTRDLKLEAIIVPTLLGTTAQMLAAHRVTVWIVGVCSREWVCRCLGLHWG